MNFQLKLRKNLNIIFKFKNHFFQQINSKNSLQNWVDIESEYYLQLKKITKLKFGGYKEDELKKARRSQVLKLNNEFEQIKNLLNQYLKNNVIDVYDFENIILDDDINPFSSHFTLPNHANFSKFFNDFPFRDDFDEFWERLNNNEINDRGLLFLNFNYTFSLNYYLKNIRNSSSEEIKIHGDLNNMIFGFGDETDESYQSIENIDDNEYLKNFKSFQYSSNPNYNNFFTYLDSDKFHIYIMGHSCGLSDRVLLNKVFEHKNCRGIKIFYHQKEDGSDNYLDVIHNISRHFEDKQSMRRKIVNKEYSSPLPQTVRFKKIEKNE